MNIHFLFISIQVNTKLRQVSPRCSPVIFLARNPLPQYNSTAGVFVVLEPKSHEVFFQDSVTNPPLLPHSFFKNNSDNISFKILSPIYLFHIRAPHRAVQRLTCAHHEGTKTSLVILLLPRHCFLSPVLPFCIMSHFPFSSCRPTLHPLAKQSTPCSSCLY